MKKKLIVILSIFTSTLTISSHDPVFRSKTKDHVVSENVPQEEENIVSLFFWI